MSTPSADLLEFVGGSRFATILADPPWQFVNRTGKNSARASAFVALRHNDP